MRCLILRWSWLTLLFLTCMLRITRIVGFRSCSTAPANPEDRRLDKTKLKYGTYNTNFLFLVGYGTLKCPGKECKWLNRESALEHIKALATVIKSIDVDILQLSEVEDCTVLDALIQELEYIGDATYKPYLVRGHDRYTGQNVALLTRVDPIVDLQRSMKAYPLPIATSACPLVSRMPKSKSCSKHFYTRFNMSGFDHPITVIGAHLLANPQNKLRCHQREGQAAVIYDIAAAALAADDYVIVSGDLNDYSLMVPDRNNNKPMSRVLGTFENSGFTNVAKFEVQEKRFTQWWDQDENCVWEPKEVSSLDHIVVSNALSKRITAVAFHNDLYQANCGDFHSDHYPITVTIQVDQPGVPVSTTPARTTASSIKDNDTLHQILVTVVVVSVSLIVIRGSIRVTLLQGNVLTGWIIVGMILIMSVMVLNNIVVIS